MKFFGTNSSGLRLRPEMNRYFSALFIALEQQNSYKKLRDIVYRILRKQQNLNRQFPIKRILHECSCFLNLLNEFRKRDKMGGLHFY